MNTLFKIGYQKFKIKNKNLNILKNIKKDIEINASKLLKKNKIDLNKIHEEKFDKISFNDFRLKNIEYINKNLSFSKQLFKIYEDLIIDYFGADISVQKNINLAIQRPHDDNRAPFHKDSPPNSPYELVVWLPLVDCKKDMSMFLFNIKDNKKIDKYISAKNKKVPEDIFAKKYGNLIDCRFGEFIIFLTNTYHYIPVNSQKNTRWSFNLRYKQTFSPYGLKGFVDFFVPIMYSDVTKSVLNFDEK